MLGLSHRHPFAFTISVQNLPLVGPRFHTQGRLQFGGFPHPKSSSGSPDDRNWYINTSAAWTLREDDSEVHIPYYFHRSPTSVTHGGNLFHNPPFPGPFPTWFHVCPPLLWFPGIMSQANCLHLKSHLRGCFHKSPAKTRSHSPALTFLAPASWINNKQNSVPFFILEDNLKDSLNLDFIKITKSLVDNDLTHNRIRTAYNS